MVKLWFIWFLHEFFTFKGNFFFANSSLNNCWFRHISVRVVIIFFFSMQNVTVMLLAQWRKRVVLEVSVCAIATTLDSGVTSVLPVITAIPAACVSKSLSFYWGFPSYFCNTEDNSFQCLALVQLYLSFKTWNLKLRLGNGHLLTSGSVSLENVSCVPAVWASDIWYTVL